MKIFKNIVLLLLSILALPTGYYALLYKVYIATGVFFICLGITVFVLGVWELERKNRK